MNVGDVFVTAAVFAVAPLNPALFKEVVIVPLWIPEFNALVSRVGFPLGTLIVYATFAPAASRLRCLVLE